MSSSDGHVAASHEELGDSPNVLLLTPAMELPAGEGCAHLLPHDGLEGANLLLVTLTETPDERLSALRSALEEFEPANLGFVTGGDTARSVAAASTAETELPVGDRAVTTESVSSPGDLTGLGIKVSSVLSGWQGDGNDVVACFDSLTTLLQYAEVRQVFRFLHVLTGRFDAVGARAHYHLDPGAHEEKDVNTLKALFDAVVTYEDGSWDVSTR